jgi:hypothetical protein
LFGFVQCRSFAGRAAGDKAGDTLIGKVFDQPRQGRVVDRAMVKRRDQGNPEAREVGRVWHASFLFLKKRPMEKPPSDAHENQK